MAEEAKVTDGVEGAEGEGKKLSKKEMNKLARQQKKAEKKQEVKKFLDFVLLFPAKRWWILREVGWDVMWMKVASEMHLCTLVLLLLLHWKLISQCFAEIFSLAVVSDGGFYHHYRRVISLLERSDSEETLK